MPISIVVPQLGESVAEGTVSKWLKQVGERVRKEEPLVEIQTDKINVELPSPAEGVLEAITVPEGTTVLVGTEIGVLGSAANTEGVADLVHGLMAIEELLHGIPDHKRSAVLDEIVSRLREVKRVADLEILVAKLQREN